MRGFVQDQRSQDKMNVWNESRGFGFVEMASMQEAQKAIGEMNGKDLMDRTINVDEARSRGERRGGGRGRDRRSGYGGG